MRSRVGHAVLVAAAFVLLAGCFGEGEGEPSGPAVVTAHPVDQTVTEGEDATFTVAATGEAPVTYQWQRDGQDIPYATKPSFTVFSASLALSGTNYSCVVSNDLGSEASDAATLTVEMVSPEIYEQPRDLSVTAWEVAVFRVAAWGSGTLELQWQRDGADIAGETSTSHFLVPAELADDGAQFRCVVSNEAGSVTSDPATLTVTELAILTPALPGALTGVDYSFQLEGAGRATPYVWTVTQGTPPAGLTLDTTGLLSGNSTAVGSENVTIQMEDAGGFTVTKDFTIRICEPAIEIGAELPYYLEYIWGAPGEELTATLTATGGTAPYTWSVELGALPDGLTLDPSTGVISGTPPRGASKKLLVQVTDSQGRSNRAKADVYIHPLRPDVPRVVGIDRMSDSDGTAHLAITTWSASPMTSLTVDAMFLNSRYPTRLRAFSPPTTPDFVSMLPSLGDGEELWEVPAITGESMLGRYILTDSDGRKAVRSSGGFWYVGFGWPMKDSDSDGVPDSCDSVAGDDPSDSLEIHRDVAVRTLGLAEDVTPPELVSANSVYVGPPGARNARRFYVFEDDSFTAGAEAYIVFPDSSPEQTIAVPLAFQCITQTDEDHLKSFPGGEYWALPYIPCDYKLGGMRVWDCHGNVSEFNFGTYAVYWAQRGVIVPDTDTDGDGIDDDWELTYFADIALCVPAVDSDLDTFSNEDEYYFRTDPTDATSVPVIADSDADGVPDVLDPDDPDSYVSRHQALPPQVLRNQDSDSDGMPDIWESCYALDPGSPADASGDPDSDGLTNLNEFLRGDDPYDPDSDDDGTGDATDDEMGSSTWSSLAWSDCTYTPQGERAQRFIPPVGEWGTVYDGTCSVAGDVESYYPLAWVKILVRLYPSGELVALEASKVSDPAFYGMWWGISGEVWAAGPVGEYFEPCGYFACDTHGRITGE